MRRCTARTILGLSASILLVGCLELAPTREKTLDLGGGATLKVTRIPAGKFQMGSPDTEQGRGQDERRHAVTISKPFYMGTYPVTVAQFAAFVNETGYKTEDETADIPMQGGFNSNFVVNRFSMLDLCWKSPYFNQQGNEPVVQVSWNDANAFCQWLSKRTGMIVSLPTEAQWEYACRAGSQTPFAWGERSSDARTYANIADKSLQQKHPIINYDHFGLVITWPRSNDNNQTQGVIALTFSDWDDHFPTTSPVGTFPPNAFGLYDMIGNVEQWCSDWYAEYEPKTATDPMGPRDGQSRVIRGFGWYYAADLSRVACRNHGSPYFTSSGRGFRVAVTAGN